MTREALKHGAVNLSQGFPDFPAPEEIKRKAMEAIERDVNQYAITWGSKDFRDALTRKTKWYLGLDIDPNFLKHVRYRYRGTPATCGMFEKSKILRSGSSMSRRLFW